MKATVSILALAALFSFSFVASAQSDECFFPSKAGVVLVYTNHSADGSATGMQTDSVAVMSGNFFDGSAEIHRSVDTMTVKTPVYFKNGEVIIDEISSIKDAILSMSDNFEGAEDAFADISVEGEARGIPRDIKPGMKLPDYTVTIKVMILNFKTTFKNRKVTGEERITVGAGTFDCYVVEENVITSALMVSEKFMVKSWYARGIGLVKQETYEKNKLTEYDELSELRGL